MRFFVLHPWIGCDTETSYEPVGKVRQGEAPTCPQCGSYVGPIEWLPPYVVRVRRFGAEIGDVAFGSASNGLLISHRFLAAWRSSVLRGLEKVDAVRVVATRRVAGDETGHSWLRVAVPRTDARIDARRSRIVRQGPVTCDFCGGTSIVDAFLRLCIDESSWKGEDIFRPWGVNGVTVVTERVPLLASAHGLKNVTVTPIESFEWDSLGSRQG